MQMTTLIVQKIHGSIAFSRGVLLTILSVGLALPVVALGAETIMSPRTKAEHEADLKRMNELYGPKQDAKLQDQVQAQAANNDPAVAAATVNATPIARPATPSVATPAAAAVTPSAPAAKADRIRAELSAVGTDRFKFGGKTYTRTELEAVLIDLASSYPLDHIALLSNGDPIQLSHLIELSKLSEALKKPAMYQSGNQFKAVN
jgi:hypothetical protein